MRCTFYPTVQCRCHNVTLRRVAVLLDRDPAEMERVVGTNVFGAFATIQAFYPLLKVRLGGLRTARMPRGGCISAVDSFLVAASKHPRP